MGKDRLAARQDLWVTQHTGPQRKFVRPEHPRPIARPDDYTQPRAGRRVFSFTTLRLVSPIVVPFMLTVACFILLLLLGLGGAANFPLAIGVEGLGPAFFVYAALGVILAAALAYAPNEAIWALAMLVGLLGYGVITVWAIFGPLIALLLLGGLASLLLVGIRRQLHTVLEETAHVMVLFGKHHRTLRPGFNLRLPFEQVWAIINTAEVVVEVRATAPLAGGEMVEATVTAACRVPHERAHLAAAHGNAWVDHVRRSLTLVLHETLAELTPADIAPQEADWRAAEVSDPLAVRLRGKLGQLVGGWGVSVAWVRPHALRLVAPSAPTERPITHLSPSSAPDIASGPHVAVPAPSLSMAHVPSASSTGALRLPDVVAMRGVTPGALLPLPPAMQSGTPSPEALAEAYAAVRERRISDPATITRIAGAFERVAADPILVAHLPFDAAEAAHNLHALAAKLS